MLMLRELQALPDMWGKIKPEWVQANECSECGLEEDRDVTVKNTRWMQELPFTPKALP
jgi:hypothetical protein